ncbi:MAG: hypothetical protein EAZ26_10005, partial [Runella slithyformis]
SGDTVSTDTLAPTTGRRDSVSITRPFTVWVSVWAWAATTKMNRIKDKVDFMAVKIIDFFEFMTTQKPITLIFICAAPLKPEQTP